MKLHYRQLGQGKPLIILHGLFGFSDNWQTHAKKLAEYFQVTLVDLRNHGHSPWSDAFSYALMVQDLHELFSDLKIASPILLGHSMGGKLAMHYDMAYPNFLDKLIVVDMGVKAYPAHHAHILAAIHAIDLTQMTARSQAEAILRTFVDSDGVRQFLLKNLYWEDKGKLAWRVNFTVLEASMPEILSALPSNESFTPALFIRGLLSNYILDEDFDQIESFYPDTQFASIPDAGHWVHAEAPDAFLDVVLSFCLR
ncbi:MAG: alpha/beta fold hydrolase [Sphingomonadales bacterium]|nr:alpha/beta fold hydrolase [Sphingomonadales bacterium]